MPTAHTWQPEGPPKPGRHTVQSLSDVAPAAAVVLPAVQEAQLWPPPADHVPTLQGVQVRPP